MEKWSEHVKYLKNNNLDENQIEVIRMEGARRRHEGRVNYCLQEIIEIVGRICKGQGQKDEVPAVYSAVSKAILRSLNYIDAPGSAKGSGPPGWFKASPHVYAMIDAMKTAIGVFDEVEPCSVTGRIRENNFFCIYFDRFAVDINQKEVGPKTEILAEHALANYIHKKAKLWDYWLFAGRERGKPPPEEKPDKYTSEAYMALISRRRNPTE
jgi:hypothetical protein